MLDWTSNVIHRIRKVLHINKSQKVVTGNSIEAAKVIAEKSDSKESIDSGFVDSSPGSVHESQSSSTLSSKSILRQSFGQDATSEVKKKVSICAPASPETASKKLSRTGRRMKLQKVTQRPRSCSPCGANKLDISDQIRDIIEAAKKYLMNQNPRLTESIELLFTSNMKSYLEDLTPHQIADLLYSLRLIMFEPPCLYQDIIVTKVLELLVIVTKLLHLDSLRGQCEDVARECQSRNFYQDSELYWVQASFHCLGKMWSQTSISE